MYKQFIKEEEAMEFAKELGSNTLKYKNIEVYVDENFYWENGDLSTSKFGKIYTVYYEEITLIDRIKMAIAA